jgi:hypothetical protein
VFIIPKRGHRLSSRFVRVFINTRKGQELYRAVKRSVSCLTGL